MNIENLVRSGVVLAVGLPVALSLNNLVTTTARLAEAAGETSKSDQVVTTIKGDLTEACVKYLVSKVDSKLERESRMRLMKSLVAKSTIAKFVSGSSDIHTHEARTHPPSFVLECDGWNGHHSLGE